MQIIQPISAKGFNWNKDDKAGTSFASDLGFLAGQTPGYQIYDDSCDIGFLLKGNEENILFVLDGWVPEIINGEHTGEGWWRYSQIGKRGVIEPNGFTLIIFND